MSAEVSDALVEKAARAICVEQNGDPDDTFEHPYTPAWKDYEREARAAIAAVHADLVAEAWQEGKNAGAADSAEIVGWGVQGAPAEKRPELSSNPYRAEAFTDGQP